MLFSFDETLKRKRKGKPNYLILDFLCLMISFCFRKKEGKGEDYSSEKQDSCVCCVRNLARD